MAMSGSRRTKSYKALALLWAFAMAALLLAPGNSFSEVRFSETVAKLIEVGVHFFGFLVLAFLAVRSAPREDGSTSSKRRRVRLLTAVLAYCVLLEIAQIPIPGRGFEFTDIAIGGLGTLVGFLRRG